MVFLDTITEPYWYDTLKTLYEEGPCEKGATGMEHVDHLEETNYVTHYGDDEYILSLEGESAFNDFRNQRLKYATLNVSKIVAILIAVVGATSSLIVGIGFTGNLLIILVSIIISILLGGAFAIEVTLKKARE